MRDTEEAFKWVIKILKKNNVKYMLAGGFAANLYGSKRKLADIDIDISDNDFLKLLPNFRKYLIYGPSRYIDESWDLNLMTLKYKQQVIDIAGQAKIFNKQTNEWELLKSDFSKTNKMLVFGVEISVINKKELIAYKSKLLREVDIEDVTFLAK
jgi:hypothetical protein